MARKSAATKAEREKARKERATARAERAAAAAEEQKAAAEREQAEREARKAEGGNDQPDTTLPAGTPPAHRVFEEDRRFDLNIVKMVREEVADDTKTLAMLDACEDYLDGGVEPLRVKPLGTNIAGGRKYRRQIPYRDSKRPGKRLYRFELEPAGLEQIQRMAYSEFDPDGVLKGPFLHVVFDDGSQVDLALDETPKQKSVGTLPVGTHAPGMMPAEDEARETEHRR